MSFLALLIFPAIMVVAASSDLLTMRISNKLVLLLVAGFCLLAFVVNLPLQQFALHVTCALTVLAVGFVLFALGWIGGGDAKLAAATTLWLGFGMTLPYLLYTAIAGGVLTLLVLVLRGTSLPKKVQSGWAARLLDRKSGVPYGVAMAIAGLLTYSNSAIFERLSG